MQLPALYRCTEDVKAVLDAYMDDDSQEAVDTIESVVGVFEAKAESVAAYILHIESQQNMLSEHIKILQAKQKSIDDKREKLKTYLASNMKASGVMKISADDGSFCASFRKNPPKVDIYDEAQIPQEFMRIIPERQEVDKAAIKKAIQAGMAVTGANLVQGESFQIK